jgi:signal transduction histidine kinase
MAFFFSQRISRPLRQLALQTEQLDLDHLDAQFTSARRDEVGHLTRLLGRMTTRLRDSVGRLRAAEHKATLGEVARQVNHDIRNGLTPLRNVLRHLGEVADSDPRQLDEVFGQRRKTLDEGLGYLEELAAHYARLSPPRNVQPCRLAEIVDQSLLSLQAAPGVTLENKLGTNLPTVLADPVSLRRIFDNLVRNALESLPEGQGTISVNAFLEEDPLLEEMRVLVEVADTGEGIAQEHLDDIFQDFFTTRSQGTGLGLSNVRRLAADCGAQVRVASQVGQGTTFTLSFPVSGMS